MTLEEIFSVTLGIPQAELREDTSPATDRRWTSLGHLKLVAALEELYGIRLTHQQIRSLRTLGTARALVAGKGAPAP